MESTAALSEYVTLVSSDGFVFKIERCAAEVSPVIRGMLAPKNGFVESKTNRCVFENINGITLEKVCEYLYYNEKHKETVDVPDLEVPPALCLETLMASDYLNSQSDYESEMHST